MMKGHYRNGFIVGLGATTNVEVGWMPDHVTLYNLTDGDIFTEAFLKWAVAFTSGGVYAVAAGDIIQGVTSGAKATLDSVLIQSGTMAAGTAAGFFMLREGTLTGTFQSENIIDLANSGATDDATVTANAVTNIATTTAAALATGTSAISRYEGVAGSNAKGFTIGSVIAEANKLLFWEAIRLD